MSVRKFGFGTESRVRERTEYLRISREGRRVTTPHFVFLLARSKPPQGSALGITVTKKIANSVGRSRYKRLLREAFRNNPDFHLPEISLVVIVRTPNPALTRGDVENEWSLALPKLRSAAKKL